MDEQGRGEFVGDHHELTRRVIGVFYNVANELGVGSLESVYRRAMVVALSQAGLDAREELAIPVMFRGVCWELISPISLRKACWFLS